MAKKKKVTYWFGADITELEKGMKRIENSAKRMSYSTAHLGKIMSKNITAPLTGLGALAIRESISFESAFANVKKTVIGTEEQLKKLEKGILKLSTEMPTTAKDIAEVAASAGQLGIETENILTFTKAMIQLGETSNMSANEAADALARFANITRMNQRDFDRLGSTVVALGNSLATTEKEVVEMSLRLAGAAKQIGMTEPEILAFAGSLSSVGIEAQAGGSAFSKLMINMKLATVTGGQELKNFAAVAGVTASEFKTLFAKDASGAILKFIQGLASLEGTGVSAIEVLDKMGITEIRLRDAILRATGASDIFSRSLALGRTEWEQNNAMQKKTAAFYQTTEAQLKILRNQVMLTAKEIGDTLTPSLVVAAEKLRDVVKAFSDLSPEIKTNIVEWGLAAAAIGPLLIITSKAISGFKELLLNARKFTAFLSNNPALLAVAAMVGTYSAMDKSPGMQETLSERQGLGLNESGKSAETQALRDLKALTASISSATNSLAAIKALDAAMSTATVKPLVDTTVTTPILDDIGGGGSSKKGKTETDLLVQSIQDRMKYLGEDGNKFLVVLDKWQAKLKPLSEDWKKVTDLKLDIQSDNAQKAGKEMSALFTRIEEQKRLIQEAKDAATEGVNKYYESLRWENQQGLLGDSEYLVILKARFDELTAGLGETEEGFKNVTGWSDEAKDAFAKLQSVGGGLANETMELLRGQFEAGTLTGAQYVSALQAIRVQFEQYPAIVKMADQAIAAFNETAHNTLPTVASQVKAAWDDMQMSIAQVPTAMGDAFMSAIKGSKSLGDALNSLLADIGAVIAKALIMKYLVSPIMGFMGFADGGVFQSGQLTAFASGGIVNKPTLFPFASGVGLMGEAGAEAIMPLKRTSSGDLGVQAEGGGGITNITMNINAVDSKSFVEMMRTNRASVESIVVENIMRNGAVRGAIRGMA